MRRTSIIIALMWLTIGTWAQQSTEQLAQVNTKMSPWLLKKYQQHQADVKRHGGQRRADGRPVRNYILTLVESTDGSETIREKGGAVWQDFGHGISAAFLPMDSLGVLDRTSAILRMEANELPKLLNDTSAVIIGVDKVNSGASQLPQAFKGKGVIAAVMDVGFDFTHPAFRNDDGTSRIKWFWDPLAPDANSDIIGMIYNSPEQVLAARHSMDADVDNHGTHVLGSMAGRGLDGRYVGMAPEADIMGAYFPLGSTNKNFWNHFADYLKNHIEDLKGISDLVAQMYFTDVFELVQLYKIFEQADAAGQPCVVNWSFGSRNQFFMDYTLFEQVINRMLGPGHIVVAAAGNDGGNMTYLKKDADTPLEHDVYYRNAEEGFFYLLFRFGEFSDNFKIGLTFENVADTLFIDGHAVLDSLNAGKQSYVAALEQVSVEVWAWSYPGERFGFEFDITTSDDYALSMTKNGAVMTSGKLLIDAPFEVEVTGWTVSPQNVLFSSDNYRTSRGCNLATICYPSELSRIISAGAMHHRSQFTNIQGDSTTYREMGSEEGHLISFSSCGPTLDGRIKPDVVAPGHNILSTLNSFYYKYDGDKYKKDAVEPYTAYTTEAYGRTYGMFAMSGTSMASPITAGVIALWLQAKPDLTPEDIMGVIERTSHQPEPEFSGTDKNVYYGWGEIDAYAGLLDILGIGTSIPSLSKHQPAGVTFRVEGRTLYIDGLDGDTPVTVYNLSGVPVLRTTCADGPVALPILPAGVYAVQIGRKGSTLIRLD